MLKWKKKEIKGHGLLSSDSEILSNLISTPTKLISTTSYSLSIKLIEIKI